jgi:hypothetical protein
VLDVTYRMINWQKTTKKLISIELFLILLEEAIDTMALADLHVRL